MDQLARQVGSQAVEAPEVGVISMDGGRYQRRELFGQVRAEGQTHWRESKVGCLLSMRSVEAAEDPHPELPDWLLESRCVRELASPMGPMGLQEAAGAEEPEEQSRAWEGPELVAKEVLASGEDGESFGRQLGGRAWQRGFLRARRLAFVADGAGINWQVQQEHFPQAMPILDLMHALSYAYGASRALKEPEAYVRWAGWIWSGQVDRVIGELDEYRRRLGPAPPDGSETDARQWVDRAWTYYQNHRSRMNYPEYRRLGLPLTSSHMESTIKQINRRVKGTEKFWTGPGSEAVL